MKKKPDLRIAIISDPHIGFTGHINPNYYGLGQEPLGSQDKWFEYALRYFKKRGIDALVISSDCAELYNPKTVRAAMGALFTQRIIVVNSIVDAVLEIRKSGARVFAAALNHDAKRLGEIDLKRGDAILIGNEGHGLSVEAIDACDECIYIPMEQGSESLNASIAASVCMWEIYKIK